NDPIATLKIGSKAVEEGDNGTKVLTFTVQLSNASSEAVEFDWKTVDGSAIASTMTEIGDYVAMPTTHVKIGAGSTTATLSVVLNGDTADEIDEQFQVQLSNITGNVTFNAGVDDVATGTIENDDATVRIS